VVLCTLLVGRCTLQVEPYTQLDMNMHRSFPKLHQGFYSFFEFFFLKRIYEETITFRRKFRSR